jgi:hypothetical protein
LAFEHRVVAAVADPGVVDVSTSWAAALPKELLQLVDASRRSRERTGTANHSQGGS